MPTNKPRIAVTLSPPVYEVIERLAALQGCSRSSVVAELLEAVYPPLMRTVALLEAALEAPRAVHDGLRQTILGLELDMVSQADGALGRMDWLLEEMRRASSAGSGDASAVGGAAPDPAAPEGVNPRVVTRGSGGRTRGSGGQLPAFPKGVKFPRKPKRRKGDGTV